MVFNPEDVPRQNRRFFHEVLYRDELLWGVPKGHVLTRCKFLSLKDLAAFPFLVLPRTSHVRRVFDRIFQARGIEPRFAMELDSEDAIEKLVEINFGITLRSRWRGRGHKICCLRISGEPVHCQVGLVLPSRRAIAKPILDFAQRCRSMAGARRAEDGAS